MRKIAILGKCSNTRHHCPMGASDWEFWCLGWDPTPVVDRMFEIHENWRTFQGQDSGPDEGFHRRWLMYQKVPVYMNDVYEDIPNSVKYPLGEVAELIGRTAKGHPYLESSIAYMMALAMLEYSKNKEPMKIGLWGIDLAPDTEYTYQKPNLEYLIGMARGMGIKVFVPPESALLSSEMGALYGHWTAEQREAMEKSKKAAA